MDNWREFQKRKLDKTLRSNAAKQKAQINTALTDLDYIEKELLPLTTSNAQFEIAQKAMLGVQIQFMRLQLEAMLKE